MIPQGTRRQGAGEGGGLGAAFFHLADSIKFSLCLKISRICIFTCVYFFVLMFVLVVVGKQRIDLEWW